MTVLLVSLDDDVTLDAGWARDARVVSDTPRVLGIDQPSTHTVGEVAAAIADGRARSGALVANVPEPDRLWVAHEWWRRLVVQRDLMTGIPGWHPVQEFEELVVLAPLQQEDERKDEPQHAAVVSASEFRSGLRSPDPLHLRLDLRPSVHEDEAVFGELVPSRLGGSSALLALSGARPGDDTVDVRNLCALELDWLDGADTTTAHRRTGAVSCVALGLSDGTQPDLQVFAKPAAVREAWDARHDEQAQFWVLLELSAAVDPPIWIPAGQVFGQQTVNGYQTLAAARSVRATVTPGALVPLALPAWCLNRQLSPPAGQRVDPAPLRGRYAEGTSQSDVWMDRDRIMGAA